MNETEIVNHLIETAKNNQSMFRSDFWTSVGFYLLVIGWIINSKDVRDFADNNKLVKNLAVFSAIVIYILNVSGFIYFFNKSQEIESVMLQHVKIHPELMDLYDISFNSVIYCGIANLIFVIVIIALLNNTLIHKKLA